MAPITGGTMRLRDIAAGVAAVVVASAASAAPQLVQHQVAVSPGVELRVIEAGRTNSSPAVVFIPGWSAAADIWSGQIERFAGNRRVIAFDPRSQGDSTKTTSGNTPEQRAIDLHALLTAEHVQRPVLVGWSQAAQDVAAYVERYGSQNLTGIVLVDAAVSDGAKGIASRPDDAATQFGRFATYVTDQRAYLRGMFGAIISKPQPAGTIESAIATAMKTPTSVGIAMLVADMFGTDRTAALEKMECPVLIVAAASSPELARQKAEAKLIRNVRFVEIPDSAHAVFLDQPEKFAAALAEFLKQVDAR
jgi:microsomal epoxide hydrolase